jgi:HrpA-like RNA helicase
MLDDDERDLEIAALETVATIATKYPPGDILVFMPGGLPRSKLCWYGD